jgi:hypothetical protein
LRTILAALLGLTLGMHCWAGAKPKPTWNTGMVLDSTSSRTYMPTGATTQVIQETQLRIAGLEYEYVVNDPLIKIVGNPLDGSVDESLARSAANRWHGCRFIVGGNALYWQEGAKLHVLDEDGKECKLDIVRQERIKKP